MFRFDAKSFAKTTGSPVAFCLLLVAASLLTGCGGFNITKPNPGPKSDSETSMTVNEWLNAWAALQAGNQNDDAPTTAQSVKAAAAPEPAGVASGVSLGAERDRRPTSNKRSGSRLRTRVVLTDEGHQAWVGWCDRERRENCDFELDAEGTIRCLPSNVTRDVHFADSECTQRVAAVTEPDVTYALHTEGTGCAKGARVFALGRAVQAPTAVFARDRRGKCVAEATPAAGAYRVVADEVPLSEFLAARQGVEGGEARIKALGLVADDGAIAVTGFVDSELQTPCEWQGTHRTVCVPQAANVSTFADEACSQPLLTPGRSTCAPDVTFGVAREPDSCELAYYQPGEVFAGSTVYEMTEQSYQSREVSEGEASALQLGVRISRGDLASGKLERVAGATTRLVPQHWTTRDRGVWFSNWYDNVLESTCEFTPSGDNEWQCLPSDAGDRVMFADAMCTQPITEVAVDSCEGSATPPRFVTTRVSDGNGHTTPQVRRVLEARPYLATVYEQTELGCEARAVDEGHAHFDLSQPLPATSFVRGLSSVL